MTGRVVVVLLAAVLLAGCSSSSSLPRSSDPADWRASVCKPGSSAGLNSLVEGIDAADLQVCISADSTVYIASGKYSSQDSLEYYLQNYSAFRGNPYATASVSGGGVWAFNAFTAGIDTGNAGVALQPLNKFGFQVHSTAQTTQQHQLPSAQPSPTSPPQTRTASPGNMFTISDYIKQNGITETPVVKSGDPPGAPLLYLPSPPGWSDSGNTPRYAYGQIVPSDPAFASDPPTITAILARLTGDVDADAILRYAPGELNNLPGFKAALQGESETFAGFSAYKLAGAYLKNGVPRVVGQRTVVIPGRGGLYVLQFNVDSPPGNSQLQAVADAFKIIKEQTVIKP